MLVLPGTESSSAAYTKVVFSCYLLHEESHTQGHIIHLDWHFKPQRQDFSLAAARASVCEPGSTNRCVGNCDVACGRRRIGLQWDCPDFSVLLPLPLNVRILNFIMCGEKCQ